MKIVKILISGILMLSFFSNVSALKESIEVQPNIEIADQESPINVNAYLNYKNLGSNRIMPMVVCSETICVTETINITGLTKYYQNLQSWSPNIMQSCGFSIETDGCALTSLSMIANKYTTDRNPGQLNTFLGNLACPMSWASAATKLGLQYEKLYQNVYPGGSLASVKDVLLGVLRAGRPVLLGMTYMVNNKVKYHYVVVKGYTGFSDGSYSFSIYDPSANKDYLNLMQYMNLGYGIIQIHVYY